VSLQGAFGGGFDWMKRFDKDLGRKGVVRRFSAKIKRGMNLKEGENELENNIQFVIKLK
jgi:hypothetical protein